MPMKKRLCNHCIGKRYSLIIISFAFIIFLFTSHSTQSMSRIYRYNVSPNISIETDKIKAEVLYVFEQTLIESGFKITRHIVSDKNRYLYKITLLYKNINNRGELILFHGIDSDNYVLERVLFESREPGIEDLGDEIVTNLIINPFKAKVSE